METVSKAGCDCFEACKFWYEGLSLTVCAPSLVGIVGAGSWTESCVVLDIDLRPSLAGLAILELLSLTNTLGGVCMDPGDGTGAKFVNSLVGDDLPGGLKARLVGESGLADEGVLEREFRMLEAGLIGGPMAPLLLKILDRRRRVGDGDGEICDNVSAVLSDKDGRGLRFSLTSATSSALAVAPWTSFSLP